MSTITEICKTLAIVPARSGSMGVVDKNIRQLGHKPLLAWTAEQLANVNDPQLQVILSTDSEQYARIGENFGLHAPFIRPPQFSGETATALDVLVHALQWFQTDYHYLPEQVMWLQPTSPFRGAHSIRLALDMMNDQAGEAVIGCQEIYRNLTTLFRCDDGFLSALDKQQPTQTSRFGCQPLLTPNGAMYLCKTQLLLENHSFYPSKTLALRMNKIQSLDIDTDEDWLIAEAYIKQGLV